MQVNVTIRVRDLFCVKVNVNMCFILLPKDVMLLLVSMGGIIWVVVYMLMQ